MTRQQRITLEQVRAKKNEALGRMNAALKKIADVTEVEGGNDLYLLHLDELGHARRDFDAWNTVFNALDHARQYPGLNPDLVEPVADGRWVAAVGDPWDGLQLVGPFEDGDAASNWADTHVGGQTWWTLEIQKPDAKEWG